MPGPQGRQDRTEAIQAGTRHVVSRQQCSTVWTALPPCVGGPRPGQDPVLAPSVKSSPKPTLLGFSFPICNGEAESQSPAVGTAYERKHAPHPTKAQAPCSKGTRLSCEVRQWLGQGQQG